MDQVSMPLYVGCINYRLYLPGERSSPYYRIGIDYALDLKQSPNITTTFYLNSTWAYEMSWAAVPRGVGGGLYVGGGRKAGESPKFVCKCSSKKAFSHWHAY